MMQLSVVSGFRPTATISASHKTTRSGRQALRSRTSAAGALAAPVLPGRLSSVPAEERAASEALQAALACLAPHPSALQAINLVPTLQTALAGLTQRAGCAIWDRAVLASPILLGLLSLSTDLLDQPAVGALGPEAPVLVLEVLSYLAPGDDEAGARQAQHCRTMWRRAHAALGGAASAAGQWQLENELVMGPDMLVRYYEAAARSPFAGSPTKSNGLGLLLRSHLYNKRFTAGESTRLLSAWAQLRRRMPFNPDSYNFAALAAHLSASAAHLSGEQLLAVAQAAPAFPWPTYRSVPLLHAVSREALQRSLSGRLPLPLAQRVMSASAKGAAAMCPRLAHELEEATSGWIRTTPGVVFNNSLPVPTALPGSKYGLWAGGAVMQQYAQPVLEDCF